MYASEVKPESYISPNATIIKVSMVRDLDKLKVKFTYNYYIDLENIKRRKGQYKI